MTVLGHRAPARHAPRSSRTSVDVKNPWRPLSTVALIGALGLLIISLAFGAGRSGQDGSAVTAAYWVGQLLIVAPIGGRLLSQRPPPLRESMGLVGLLVVIEYAVKICYSPIAFTFPDELQHWRSTQDILQTGRLFTYNFSLPISPHYPGLENVTAALSSVTGLSVFTSGVLVIGTAHLLLAALLYALFYTISGSTRVAGIACLIYAMSPHFAFFDSMFIYQSVALPFLVLAMFAVLHLTRPSGSRETRVRAGWWVALVLSLLTVTITHHITSYMLTALLALLTAVSIFQAGWRAARVPGLALAMTAGATAVWLAFAAPTTLSYFRPAITRLAESLTGGLSQHSSGANAQPSLPAGPLWDRVLVLILVTSIGALLPYGALRIWRAGRRDIFPMTLLVASMSYYFVLLVRLVASDGVELAGRALTFVFIPVAYVVAIGVVHLMSRPKFSAPRGRTLELLTVGLAVTMFGGGIAGGWPPYWERLPGPYQVGGFERSVSPQGIAAAHWALTSLGRGQRFGVDIGNAALLATYGQQDALRNAASLYYSDSLGPTERAYLTSSALRYLFVDRRLAQSLPVSGNYFQVEVKGSQAKRPIPLRNLDKYDGMQGVSRVYDSGDIVIYDLRGLPGAQ